MSDDILKTAYRRIEELDRQLALSERKVKTLTNSCYAWHVENDGLKKLLRRAIPWVGVEVKEVLGEPDPKEFAIIDAIRDDAKKLLE